MAKNKTIVHSIGKYFLTAVIGFILGVVLVFSAQYAYFQFLPRSTFFTWYSEDVVRAQVGEPLLFKSDREIKIDRPVRYNDTLLCGDEHGFFNRVHQSITISSSGTRERPENYDEIMTGFTLDGHTLDEPAQCFLRTRICMNMPVGNERCQSIETQLFIVVPEDE